MGYHRIRYRVERAQSEPLSQALEQCAALAVTIEDANGSAHFDRAAPRDPAWETVYVTGLFADSVDPQTIREQLRAVAPSPPEVEHLAEQDWARVCLQQFKPLRISPRLWICPSWITPPDPDAVNVVLDPGLAFGTGAHATTALCLEWLAGSALAGKRVVDYGCGSGILAVAALKLGAGHALAVDIDPRARAATLANATANQVAGPRLEILAPEQVPGDSRADIVIANILADVLVEQAPVLGRMLRANGTILLTGILESQLDQVRAAYAPSLAFSVDRRDEWCLLVGRRRPEDHRPGAQ